MQAKQAESVEYGNCLGLLCSARCPGGLVLKLYDVARALRDAGVKVVGGFQTPMEQEALTFLLRGQQLVVWVPSWHRSFVGLPPDALRAHQDGRLILENLFPPGVRRPNRARAHKRNRWIVEHVRALLVVHATFGGETHEAMKMAARGGLPVALLTDPANKALTDDLPSIISLEPADVAVWFKSL